MHSREKVKSKPDAVDVSVGERVRYFRLMRGFSQEQIAQQLDISFQQIQKYEKGINRLSASRLYTLSKVLGVSISDFYPERRMEESREGNFLPAIEYMDREDIEILKLFEKISDKATKKNFIKLLKSLLQKET